MSPSVIVSAALLIGIGLWAVVLYNRLIRLRNAVREAWVNISVALGQRHDELLKLVDLCKRYMTHEADLLEKLTRLRGEAETALHAGDVGRLGTLESDLQHTLPALLARAEAYPELKADGVFKDFMDRVSTLEGTIADRRETYNDATTTYNTATQQFPDLIIAGLFRFRTETLLEITGEAVADVNLGSLL